MLENKTNKPVFRPCAAMPRTSIEEVGARLRTMIAWIGASKIVDKSKELGKFPCGRGRIRIMERSASGGPYPAFYI